MAKSRRNILVCWGIFALALAIRLAFFAGTYESGGDGPARSSLAWSWHNHPALVLHWAWLPAPIYLSGMVEYLLPDPVNVPRLINVLVGSATASVMYLLAYELYGVLPSLIAGTLVAALPLHVVLSCTGLSEVEFCFCLLSACLFIIYSFKRTDRWLRWHILAVAMLVLAQMTRFEAWTLAFIYPLFLLAQKDKRICGITTMLALATFPVAWLAANYLTQGQATILSLLSRKIVIHDTSLAAALSLLWQAVLRNCGWPLALLFTWGAFRRLVAATNQLPARSEIFFAVLACAAWIQAAAGALKLGSLVVDRYLLFSMTACLTWAAVGLTQLFLSSSFIRKRRWLLPSLALPLILIYMLRLQTSEQPDAYLYTQEQPAKIIRLASMLQQRHLDQQALITTQLDARFCGSLLPLYLHTFDASKFLVLSNWASDDQVVGFLRKQRPSILVIALGETQGINRRFPPAKQELRNKNRFEALSGIKLSDERLICTSDNYSVYDISAGAAVKPAIEPRASTDKPPAAAAPRQRLQTARGTCCPGGK